MTEATPTLAIIGGGLSGLATAKSALECNLTPTVFEKESELGGVWNPSKGAAWEGMRTNLSYWSCMFSDHAWTPTPSHYFPKASEVFAYLKSYAETFALTPHIRYGSEVIQAKQMDSKWQVTWQTTEKTVTAFFDYLVVASGIFSKAHIPDIEGKDSFTGEITHVHTYTTPSSFIGKKVVIIGNAFSGTEIATELADTAERVTLIAHAPYVVLSRHLPIGDKSIPLDLVFYKRESAYASASLSPEEQNKRKNAWLRKLSDQEKLPESLRVTEPLEEPARVVISDEFYTKCLENSIEVILGDVAKISSTGLALSNGKSIEADKLLFATGYRASLPFFDREILDKLEFDETDMLQPLLLHRATFPNKIPNLGFVGMYRGPYFGIMELQARWVTMVFAKMAPSPSEEALQKGIERERAIRLMTPRPQFPHGDYVVFADSIAKEIGVYPEEFSEDESKLREMTWKSPLIPPHFRLTGFASNREAAKGLLDRYNKEWESL